ncbi:hypothetical protein KIPB_012734, partial [Kipferlia bialata]
NGIRLRIVRMKRMAVAMYVDDRLVYPNDSCGPDMLWALPAGRVPGSSAQEVTADDTARQERDPPPVTQDLFEDDLFANMDIEYQPDPDPDVYERERPRVVTTPRARPRTNTNSTRSRRQRVPKTPVPPTPPHLSEWRPTPKSTPVKRTRKKSAKDWSRLTRHIKHGARKAVAFNILAGETAADNVWKDLLRPHGIKGIETVREWVASVPDDVRSLAPSPWHEHTVQAVLYMLFKRNEGRVRSSIVFKEVRAAERSAGLAVSDDTRGAVKEYTGLALGPSGGVIYRKGGSLVLVFESGDYADVFSDSD